VKIFYQYSTCKTLKPISGDLISEIGILTALSQFADVYYSGTLFKPGVPGYGLQEYRGSIESRAAGDYDVYYVRSNKPVFRAIPRRKPRLWMAAPFDLHCYRDATAIATFSKAWAKDLRGPNTYTRIPKLHQNAFRKIVTVYQVVGDNFRPMQDAPRTQQIRKNVGGEFVIGFFGCTRKSRFPFGFIRIWRSFVARHPQVRLLLAVTENPKNLSFSRRLPNISRMSFSHAEMPNAVSACDLMLIARQQEQGEICGCSKTLEAAACGVPILLGAHAARMEALGEDYPFFQPPIGGWNSGEDGIQQDGENTRVMLETIIGNPALREQVAKSLPEKAKAFSVEESGKRLKKLFQRLVKKT